MKRIAALIMGFVLMTVLVAPASAKELVVAHDTNFMPFEFKGPDGKFTGFDIELWETIAKKLGLSYKFQPMDFNGIIPGLQTGNVDVGIAGMTITPERAKVVQFSNGYYTSGLKILVRDDEKGISKVEDLAGKVVAVKTGTSSVPFMKDFGKAKELKQFPNNDGMFFELLEQGRRRRGVRHARGDRVRQQRRQGQGQGRRPPVRRPEVRHRLCPGQRGAGEEGQRRP